jgi:hypothetical protein
MYVCLDVCMYFFLFVLVYRACSTTSCSTTCRITIYLHIFLCINVIYYLLITLLHIIKVYRFDKPAKDLLVRVDQVLFARWPRSYMPYHSFSLCSGVITVEQKVIHWLCSLPHLHIASCLRWNLCKYAFVIPCSVSTAVITYVCVYVRMYIRVYLCMYPSRRFL